MIETLKKLEPHLAIALCDFYASLSLATSYVYPWLNSCKL